MCSYHWVLCVLVEAFGHVQQLQSLNYNVRDNGHVEYLRGHNIEVTTLHKPSSKLKPNRFSISLTAFELVINIPDGFRTETVSDGYLIRTAVDFGVGLITNIKCAIC